MKKSKLFKTLLIPSLCVLTIGTIAAEATSCSCALFHVTAVEVDPQQMVLSINETREIQAIVYPENATDKSVTWTSSDTNVATVENGKVTAVAVGNATIIVITSDGHYTDTCAVTVVEPIHVESVTLDKHDLSLVLGDNDYLTATVSPADAADKSVTWASDNETVATVDKFGKVTAVGKGTTNITVTTNDGHYTDTCAITVVKRVTEVDLDQHEFSIYPLETCVLTATISPADATDQSVSWASDNETVATVDENGKVTAVSVGTANITVTTRDGGKTDTCEVTVTLPYVCVEANANSTLTLYNWQSNNPDLQYSTDGGTSWNTYSEEISISQGKTLYLKGNNPEGWSHSSSTYSYLSISGNVSISGNIMGLLDNGAKPGEQGDITTIPCGYCFYFLFFESTGITSISKNFLPATVLKNDCYDSMFYECTSLIKTPYLPATSLAESCYKYMFCGCTSLKQAPKLPATTLATGCYKGMFSRCNSLTQAPELSATSLAETCYYNMFYGCSSLTAAPELPATSLAETCYYNMFYDCSSLTAAPELPATSLAAECYRYMFSGCTSLTQAPELRATTLATGCYSCMFYKCASLTTAPELRATTLAKNCYRYMFYGCSSLTAAPELPATTLADNCYEGMFSSCTSLNSVKIGYTGNNSSNYFLEWVTDVAKSGTFYYKGKQTAQKFFFPDGWSTNPNW